MIITCEAIVHWAGRHAVLAREKAAATADPVRKAELLRIAEHCEYVPAYPARTFHEALQAQWFAQSFSRLEQRTGTIISNGRMDQYLYRLYRQDKDAGRLTDAQALELFDCLWLGMVQFTDLSDIRTVSVTANVPHGKEVCALPNGRKAWLPLSDGSSPAQGADVKGPTTALMSNYNTKNWDMHQRAARLLNVKFSPKCLEGEQGPRRLVDFIRFFNH